MKDEFVFIKHIRDEMKKIIRDTDKIEERDE